MFGDSSAIPTLSPGDGSITSPRKLDANKLEEQMFGSEGSGGRSVSAVYCGKGLATCLVWGGEGKDDVLTLHAPNVPDLGGGSGTVDLEGVTSIAGVSVGSKHLIAWGSDSAGEGVALTMGWAGGVNEGYGNLGLGANIGDGGGVVSVPTRVTSLEEDGTPLNGASAAGSHTAGLSGATNEVLTTGSGQYGRLGNVDAVDQLFFEPVELLMTIPEVKYTKVAAGNSYTLVLGDTGVVWGWGWSRGGGGLGVVGVSVWWWSGGGGGLGVVVVWGGWWSRGRRWGWFRWV